MHYFSTSFWYTCFGQTYCPSSGVLILLAHSQHNLYDKYLLLWMQYQNSWWWTVSLSETCRVVYRNKVEKQRILLDSITRIYYDARPSECQIQTYLICPSIQVSVAAEILRCFWWTLMTRLPQAESSNSEGETVLRREPKETAGITTYYVIEYKESVWGRNLLWDSKCYFAGQ